MPKETTTKRRGTSSLSKNRGAKKQQTSKNRVPSPRHNKEDDESGDGTRVNPALTRDDLKVSASSKRGAGKQTSKVPGGIIHEKAKSRHARGVLPYLKVEIEMMQNPSERQESARDRGADHIPRLICPPK